MVSSSATCCKAGLPWGIFGMMLWRPYSVLIVLIFALKPVLGQCYFPSGDIAQDHIPCNPFAFTSLCCPQGWTCFSGGICVITDLSKYPSGVSIGATIRGSCTNPQWDRSACGSVCLSKCARGQPSFWPHFSLQTPLMGGSRGPAPV